MRLTWIGLGAALVVITPSTVVAQAAAAAATVALVPVPSVMNRRADSARFTLDSARFVVTAELRAASPKLRGRVLEQRPAPNTGAKRGSTVHLWIGGAIAPTNPPSAPGAVVAGPQMSEVPNLLGLDSKASIEALRGSRLGPGNARREPSDVQGIGLIIHQDPPEGTRVVSGSKVDVTFSSGPRPPDSSFAMPRLLGLTATSADESLSLLGLVLDHVDSATVPDGDRLVSVQFPAPDTRVHRGDRAWFVIRIPPQRVEVPSVLGLSAVAAGERLKEVGLGVRDIQNVARADRDSGVITQRPARGTLLERGQVVSLTVNTPPAAVRVEVPALIGRTRADAETAIRAAQLTVGMVRTDRGGVDELVSAQTHDPGTIVLAGTVVGFTTVAPVVPPGQLPPESPPPESPLQESPPQKPPPQEPPSADRLLVPSVVGRTVTEAFELLSRAGFSETSIEGLNAPGAVVSEQEPRALELVQVGTRVTLTATATSVRFVPRLIGATWREAEERARREEFAAYITARRWTLTLSGRVLEQLPDEGIASPTISSIGVTLGRPAIPGLVLGAGVLFAAALGILRQPPEPRSKKPERAPPADAHVTWQTGSPMASVEPTSRTTLVKAAFELRFSVRVDSPMIDCSESSVFKSARWTDAG